MKTIGAVLAPVQTALVMLIACGLSQGAAAKNLFQLDLSVLTPAAAQAQQGYGTITDLVNGLTTSSLQSLTAAYDTGSAATAALYIRGLAATASFAAGSPVLRFTVPSLGIDITFNGGTRDASQTQFKDFLEKNGGDLLSRLLQGLAASSPIDPVAGNPNSLQSTMAGQDFAISTGIGLGSLGQLSDSEIPGRGAGHVVPNLITAGGDVGVASSGGFSSTIVTLPFRYTHSFDDPRYALTFDVPLTYVDTQGAVSAYGSAGVALRIPLLPHWYLTPTLRIGAGGSLDLGSAAIEYSGGIGSRYSLYFGDLDLTLGNAVDIVKTGGLSIGSFNVNYDLTNELFSNGLQAEGSLPYKLFGNPTSWQAYVADTAIAGSKLYISHYDEIGFTIGSRHLPGAQDWQSLRAGLGFTFGAHYEALKAAFTYRF